MVVVPIHHLRYTSCLFSERYLSCPSSSLLTVHCQAQRPITQTIRGTVIDQSLQTPIPGATVAIVSTNPLRGTMTEADGSFRLSDIPVGRQTIKISYVGYKDALLTNIVLDAGKELVLTVGLQESVAQLSEVTVKPTLEKDKPITRWQQYDCDSGQYTQWAFMAHGRR